MDQIAKEFALFFSAALAILGLIELWHQISWFIDDYRKRKNVKRIMEKYEHRGFN